MNITAIRSDEIYQKMMLASDEERIRLYREELMKPFEFKWSCIGIPLEAQTPGGMDVVSYSAMSGVYHPTQITNERAREIESIGNPDFWASCEKSIQDSLNDFEKHGIALPVQDYRFTVLLEDPKSPMAAMMGEYCGDGGIPGYITGTIIPNENSLKMLPVALAHETNHNVRWQFVKWSPEITLADMIVSEGLAESFAAAMYGEDKIGIWVKNTTKQSLDETIKPMIHAHLQEKDFRLVSAYLYGDEITALQGGEPLGVPYCAGYACGYHLVQYYLNKTNKNICEATTISTQEILDETEDFWK